MRRLVLASMLAALIACDSAPAAPSAEKPAPAKPAKTPPTQPPKAEKPKPKPAMHPINVTWKLARKSDALELSYTVENTSNKPVVLLDRLFQATAKGNLPVFDRVIVRDESSNTVSFVRGFVAAPPSGGVGNPTPPIARTLAPKEKIEDRATIPLPLVSWHNFVHQFPLLTGTKSEAVFEVGYLVGHEKWSTIAMTDGSKQTTPAHPFAGTQIMWRSEPQKIP